MIFRAVRVVVLASVLPLAVVLSLTIPSPLLAADPVVKENDGPIFRAFRDELRRSMEKLRMGAGDIRRLLQRQDGGVLGHVGRGRFVCEKRPRYAVQPRGLGGEQGRQVVRRFGFQRREMSGGRES